jgi:predicted nucleic acid-binding Zn ribbon protein
LRESKLKHCANCGKVITDKSFQLTKYCDECLKESKHRKRIRHKNAYKKTTGH